MGRTFDVLVIHVPIPIHLAQSAVTNAGRQAGQIARKLAQRAWLDYQTLLLIACVVGLLGIVTLVARYLSRQSNPSTNRALVERLVLRLRVWWLMCAILGFGLLLHRTGTIILFGFISFWAFREFITMTPTRRGDHYALLLSLVIFTPLQYILIYFDLYEFYSIVIPVYASLFIPAVIALAGDAKKFLERSAQITLGLLICVYALSHAPTVLDLKLATSSDVPWEGSAAGLLFFFVLISQLSEVFQWSWSRVMGKHVVAAEISSSRTWEGCVAGSLSAGVCGGLLYWVTPFEMWEACLMSIIVAVLGFMGGMTMSAIKRNRGVQDYGTLVVGHAGVLDRIDSLCFAAPIFYHLTRFFFSV